VRLKKNSVITDINQSKTLKTIRLSKDELSVDRNKKVNELKRAIDNRLRNKKNFTVIIVEEGGQQEMIDIEEIVRHEVDRQESILTLIGDLDEGSKRMVLDRSEDQYKRCKQLIELEEY
jgi:C4-type Zn-finger protein